MRGCLVYAFEGAGWDWKMIQPKRRAVAEGYMVQARKQCLPSDEWWDKCSPRLGYMNVGPEFFEYAPHPGPFLT